MGVKDFGALLRQYAPNSIRPLPSLAQYRHKRIAIDASLFTIKFHSAFLLPSKMPKHEELEELDEHRHVRAWYHLLRQLLRWDITPIVVFDGTTRIPAKAEENERRASIRQVEKERSRLEDRRAKLLDTLLSIAKEVDVSKEVKAERIKLAHDVWMDSNSKTEFKAKRQGQTEPAGPARSQLELDAAELLWVDKALADAVDEDALPDIAGLVEIVEKNEKLKISLKRRSTPVPRHAVEEILALVRAMGLPYVRPSASDPHEAEALAATLWHMGEADVVASEDSDVLVYGAPLLRNLSTYGHWVTPEDTVLVEKEEDNNDNDDEEADELDAEPEPERHGKTKGKGRQPRKEKRESQPSLQKIALMQKSMHLVTPAAILKELDVSQSEFLDICLCLGTDFQQGVKGLGPAKALQAIREHGSIEAVVANKPSLAPNDYDAWLETIVAARAIFTTLPPLPPVSSGQPPPAGEVDADLGECVLRRGKGDYEELGKLLKKWGVWSTPAVAVESPLLAREAEKWWLIEAAEGVEEGFDEAIDDLGPLSEHVQAVKL